MRPTISIALLSYVEADNPRFHSAFRILDVEDHVPYSDALTIHLVQLPRLQEALVQPDRAPNDALLRWGRFFAARTPEDLDEAAMTDSAVLKARDVLLRLSADPEVRRLAEIRELAQTTRRIEDAGLREEGREEGRAEGREEGRAEGREEGRAETRLYDLRESIVDLCEFGGIVVGDERRAQLEASNVEALVALKLHLKQHREWP